VAATQGEREAKKTEEPYELAAYVPLCPDKNNIVRDGSMLVSARPHYYRVNSIDFYSMGYMFDSLPIYRISAFVSWMIFE
jgi:hypothetical protein